jgi:hypothetical protein
MKISTYIFSSILILLLLFSSTRVSITYAYYELDPIGFIENLCINKDKPELECNGKCHLKKVIQSQDKEQNTPKSVIDFKELTLFSETIKPVVNNQDEYIKKQSPTSYQNLYSYNAINDCFHPPRI